MEKFRSTNDLKVYVGGEILNAWGAFKRNKGDIKSEFLDSEGQRYILVKNLGGFYNKALIYQNVNNNNNYILVSYNTIVAEIFGDTFTIYGYYSQTTAKHIGAFLNHFGIKSMSKKEIEKNKFNILNCKDFMEA